MHGLQYAFQKQLFKDIFLNRLRFSKRESPEIQETKYPTQKCAQRNSAVLVLELRNSKKHFHSKCCGCEAGRKGRPTWILLARREEAINNLRKASRLMRPIDDSVVKPEKM